jgi:predicted ATPase/serine phosphatase RsbU (regulator of sigma subunit)/tRNA A-37 threonylcarbamoyl transferase component Bud32
LYIRRDKHTITTRSVSSSKPKHCHELILYYIQSLFMLTLPNYQISTQIYESANSVVYRGVRNEDNHPVILKVLKEDYPTPEELTRYRQEYDITRRLADLDGVVKAYHLEKHQNTLVICLEDFGAESLKIWQEQRTFTLEELLTFAIRVTEILGQIHQKNIIHKDINPSNLILNPNTGVLKIIDFGIGTQLSKQHLRVKTPEVLDGTLAYMSPEQTGRMNRALDYRTDFYSLGATFYELFTGIVPFESTDAMELVHCHIAKQPTPPDKINPDLPNAISNIILKLLEKTAEARYQSAWGIKADLEECKLQFAKTGQISHFSLAQTDISERFQIPQKLYGREAEINTLVAAFERVASGKTEIMRVAGYSGIGKSVLVKEIYRSLTKGYFISGKFEQYRRNIPYSAVVNAFKELVQLLLTENEQQLSVWKNKLLTALGPNGQVIIDVIPEIEWIIGAQPAVPQLGPTESQNRFNLVFQNVMRVFCQPEHPLVMFLDDLQWVDSATLKLLKLVTTDTDKMAFFLILAYRDNEVFPPHPLITTLDELRDENVTINQISLKPLAFEHINQLIAESLHHNLKAVGSLTDLVRRKTGGNPFFVTQFLQTLYEEDWLHFVNPTFEQKGHWQWDIDQIEALNMTDNVVDLMIGKLKKLPETAQQVLRLAACIGNHFDLDTLSLIYESAETFQAIMPMLTKGLILPVSSLEMSGEDIQSAPLAIQQFRFLHDRVQQAAYALIDDEQKQAVHLQIGRLLKKNTPASALEEKVLDIVAHFNHSFELLTHQLERLEIARLNLMAGQKAKKATAYGAAANYFTVGRECLSKNSWETEYELTFNLYVEAVEVEYINGHHEQANPLSEIVLQQAKRLLDKVKVYNIQIRFYITQNRMQEALDTGLQVLEMLGISLLDSPPEILAVEELYTLPEMTDPTQLAALKILVCFYAPALITKPSLVPPVVFTMVHLCACGGNSPQAAFAYVFYGVILCGMGHIESGYQFGKLGLKVLEQFGAKNLKCKVHHLYNALIRHWNECAVNSIKALRDNVQVGLEIGDIEFAGYSILDYCSNIFLTGEVLEKVRQEHEHYITKLQQNKQEYSVYYAKIWAQLVLNISCDTEDKFCLNGRFFNETSIPFLQKANNFTPLFCVYLGKSMLSYWFKDYKSAVANAIQAEQYQHSMATLMPVAQHPFYYSLALLAQYPLATRCEQAEYLEKIAVNQQKMALWANNAPMNYQHKYDLVEAEKARVLGQNWKAAELYEKAIAAAKKSEYRHEEALAYELAAEFYLGRGMAKFAQTYMREAHYHYQQWGALAKVDHLETRYPHWLGTIYRQITKNYKISGTRMVSSSAKSGSQWLDLNSFMKAAQTLSGEIVLSRLLEKLMHIVIENAGAETGFLLLPQQEQWFIEAECQVESGEVKVLQSLEIDNQQLAETIIRYVIRTQENVVLNNVCLEGQFSRDPYIISEQPKSVLCVPLVNQGQLTGILYLENNLTTEAFTPESLEVLKVLSSQLAISIENALLYRTLEQKVEDRTAQLADANSQLAKTNTQLAEANEEITALNEQLKSENLRMSAELDVSRRLQQLLLPKDEELEAIDGLDIAGFMEPAEEVGGDYYDVLQHSGRVLFGIGDVTGHGLESGALAIMVQSAVRTLLANNETDPVKFFSALNQMVFHNVQRMKAGKSLTLALVDYIKNQLYLSGQHEELIIVRADGELEQIDTIDLGFPIGLEEDIAELVNQVTVPLNAGDVVVLYTDGITEAENLNKQLYGQKRLCEVLQQNWQKTAHEIRQAVIDDVRQFIGQQKVYDDITLLVLKQK